MRDITRNEKYGTHGTLERSFNIFKFWQPDFYFLKNQEFVKSICF